MIRLCLLICCCVVAGPAFSVSLQLGQAQMHNVERDDQGYIRNQTNDGYVTFRDLNLSRDQACAIKMDLEFKHAMLRPGIFEVFWHGPNDGFSEKKKAFVVINHKDTRQRKTYIIPLCKLFHFSGNINQSIRQGQIAGLRLDYPAKRTTDIKFHSIETVNSNELAILISESRPNMRLLEPYERINAKSFTSLDVILPKLYFAFEDGLKRLSYDKAFTFIWILMMFSLLVLILRSVLRQQGQQ